MIRFGREEKQKIAHTRGFTIVEIIVVVIVIGILAGISVVGYGAWRKDVATKTLKSDISNLSAGMNSARTWGTEYPIFPTGTKFDGTNPATKNIYTASKDSQLVYYSGDGKSYCIDASSNVVTGINLAYKSSSDGPVNGKCSD